MENNPQPPPPPRTPESTTEGTLAAMKTILHEAPDTLPTCPPLTPQETEPPYPDSIQVHLLDQIKVLVATVQIKQDEIDKSEINRDKKWQSGIDEVLGETLNWNANPSAPEAHPCDQLRRFVDKLRARAEQAEAALNTERDELMEESSRADTGWSLKNIFEAKFEAAERERDEALEAIKELISAAPHEGEGIQRIRACAKGREIIDKHKHEPTE